MGEEKKIAGEAAPAKAFTLYRSNGRKQEWNTIYQYRCEIHNADELIACARFDHVGAFYIGSRSRETFAEADVLMMDLDNSHSDNEDEWKTLDDVAEAFEDVCFYYMESRNHMTLKVDEDTGLAHEPRPKYHIYFPLKNLIKADPENEEDHGHILTEMKAKVIKVFPWFDIAAKDSARFFFYTDNGGGRYDGDFLLDEVIDDLPEAPAEIREKLIATATANAEQLEKVAELIAQAAGALNPEDIDSLPDFPIHYRHTGIVSFCAKMRNKYFDDAAMAKIIEGYKKKYPDMIKDNELDNILKKAISWKIGPSYTPEERAEYARTHVPQDPAQLEGEDLDAYFDSLEADDPANGCMTFDGPRAVLTDDGRPAPALPAAAPGGPVEVIDGFRPTPAWAIDQVIGPRNGSRKQDLQIADLEKYLDTMGRSVRYNVISKWIEFEGFDEADSNEALVSNAPVILHDELKPRFFGADKQSISDYLAVIANRNQVNPVLDLIDPVEWDGKARFPELFAAMHIDEEDTLSKTLIRRWFQQCYAMAKNDVHRPYGAEGCLTLRGPQGVGKTEFVRKICMGRRDFFKLGQTINGNDKDTARRCCSGWIIELGEVEATFRRSDVESLKSFITADIDEYRLPYGHADIRAPRRTSLIATCNSEKFLMDPTGSRRFWTIPVEKIDLDALDQMDMLQLWAEVKAAVDKNRQCFRLTPYERQQLEERNGIYQAPLKGEEEIADILLPALDDKDSYDWVDMTVTLFKARFDDRIGRYSNAEIGKVLTKLGIEEKRTKKGRFRTLPVAKANYVGQSKVEVFGGESSEEE